MFESGQFGTMIGLAKCSPLLFPPGETSSSRLVGVLEEDAPTRHSDEMVEGDGMEDDVSFVDADDVDSDLRDMMSDEKLTTFEAGDDEYPLEVILEDDDETLDDLYMPPCEAGSLAYVQIDPSWRRMCLSNKFCSRGAEAFAFQEGYELVMPSEGSRVTECLIGHVAVYARRGET